MTPEGGEEPMPAPVEDRLQSLEQRVQTLESLLRTAQAPAGPAPAEAPPAIWPPVVSPPAVRAPAAAPRPAPAPPRAPLDLEELLGGRVLAWVGGVAVFLAAVFFLVMALHNGWIDEPTRVVLAFAGSTLLLLAGLRAGKTHAGISAVAASLAALYASDTTATAVYHLVSPEVGLAVAAVIALGG